MRNRMPDQQRCISEGCRNPVSETTANSELCDQHVAECYQRFAEIRERALARRRVLKNDRVYEERAERPVYRMCWPSMNLTHRMAM